MPEDNIFLKIARGQVPADIVYEDDICLAFRDIAPQAPTHVLVIPRTPVTNLADPRAEPSTLGHLLSVCARVARDLGLEESGYRVVANVGPDAGQSVPQLHLHLLGGRSLSWPPG